MSGPFYTRTTSGFDPDTFDGPILASSDLRDTYGFSEHGYDEVDYDVAPTVFEVITRDGLRWASNQDVDAAAEAAGIQLWVGREDYLAYWPDATPEEWMEGTYREENTEANQLIARPGVVRMLEEAGYDAFAGTIQVGNSEPDVVVFWKRDTRILEGPVDLIADDPSHPYGVRLADAPAPGF